MSSEEFWGRIANNNQVRVEHRPGELVVYRGDRRVARWLPYPQVLHFIPSTGSGQVPSTGSGRGPDSGIGIDVDGNVTFELPWCPVCRISRMELYRKSDTRSFFWGCPGRWGPRRCEGTIDIQPRSLSELEALNGYLVQEHADQVADGRRRNTRALAGSARDGRLAQLSFDELRTGISTEADDAQAE